MSQNCEIELQFELSPLVIISPVQVSYQLRVETTSPFTNSTHPVLLNSSSSKTLTSIANLDDLNWSSFINSGECDKCAGNSTTFYPLSLQTTCVATSKTRTFGLPIRADGYVDLCEDCLRYLSEENINWASAWPCVNFNFCFSNRTLLVFESNQQFCSCLPFQLQASWLSYARPCWSEIELSPLFRDLTRNSEHFWKLITTYRGNDYIQAMNAYPFPSIRCFCGASAQIDEYGYVQFQHLLNFLDRKFVSFAANYEKFMKSMRLDFYDICDAKLVFELRPSVCVKAEGIVLLTCENHKRGSNSKLLHVTRHPLVGNLSHPHADRLAPVASSMREATMMKVGEFSNTWSLSKSVAGSDGAGSLVLHSQRNFAVKSQSLIPAIESTFLNNRTDMVDNMRQIAAENDVPAHLIKGFFRKYDTPDYDSCLQSATIIPNSTITKLKNFFETTDTQKALLLNVKKLSVTSTSTSSEFPQIELPPRKLMTADFTIASVAFLLLNVPAFAESVVVSEKSPTFIAMLKIFPI